MEMESTSKAAKDGLLVADETVDQVDRSDIEKEERERLLRQRSAVPPLLCAGALVVLAATLTYRYFHQGSDPPRTWGSCTTVVPSHQQGLSWSSDFGAGGGHSPCHRTSESHALALCTYAIYEGNEELHVYCDRRYYVRESDEYGNKGPWIQLGTRRGRKAPSIWQESSDCATLLGDDYDLAALKEECGIGGDDDNDDDGIYNIECSQDQWDTYLDCEGRSNDDDM